VRGGEGMGSGRKGEKQGRAAASTREKKGEQGMGSGQRLEVRERGWRVGLWCWASSGLAGRELGWARQDRPGC
jgi:hypothetical protein